MDLAAINIQRGRDHGIPSYTAWREPCGLSPVDDWNDLVNVVGPRSADRIRKSYKHVDDIDLFVGGIAERPVVGGLVGPTFACIIAQQFSNLRKGDRFWYENPDFESSFTPFQLHSIKRTNLAQILCRTMESGTMQTHVFLPADPIDNPRIQCGTGSLASMDLTPWIERDPFIKIDGFTNGDRFMDSRPSEDLSHKNDEIDILPLDIQDRFRPNLAFNEASHREDSPFNSDHSSVFLSSASQDHTFKEPTQNLLDFPGQNKPNNQKVKQPNKQVTTTKNPNPIKKPLRDQEASGSIDSKLDFSGKSTKKTTLKRIPPTTTKKLVTTRTTSKRGVIRPVQGGAIQNDSRKKQTTARPKGTSKRPNNKATSTKRQIRPNNSNKNRNKNKNNANVEIRRRNSDSDIEAEDVIEERSSGETNSTKKLLFLNQDNATKYLYNQPIRPDQMIDPKLSIQSRVNYGSFMDNDYDYNENPYTKPYVQRPASTPYRPSTSKRPSLYENNQPAYDYYRPSRLPVKNDNPYENRPKPGMTEVSYLNTKRPYADQYYGYTKKPQFEQSYSYSRRTTTTKLPTPISSPLNNRISTPFSYDTYGVHPVSSNVNYSNMKVNSRPTHSYFDRPLDVAIYSTTRRPDLHTFFIVETTKRTTTQIPLYYDNSKRRTTKKTVFTDKLDDSFYPEFVTSKYTTKKPYIRPTSNALANAYADYYSNDNSIRRRDNLTTSLYYRNTKSTKVPLYKPFLTPTREQLNEFLETSYNENRPDSYNEEYENNDNPDYGDSDETLRPTYNSHKGTYHDYSKFNDKPASDENYATKKIKYYYKGNVLYKYEDSNGLYDPKQQMKRYADFYDLPFDEKETDNYVRHLIEEEKFKTNNDEKLKTLTDKTRLRLNDEIELDDKTEARANNRKDDLVIVPFTVLTRPER